MSDTSAILSLPYIQPAQAQKHVTHNEALRLLDILVQLVVQSRALTAPPAVPAEGECHIVGAYATGPWAGRDDAIAVFETGQWQFIEPKEGWRAHVLAENRAVTFAAGGWDAGMALTVATLGVNASADTTNRLSVSAPATLLNHEGAGHQLKLNKAVAGDTASLLFQTGFSGRAEMGTTGSDAFVIKVSADGASFATALSVNPASGRPTLPQGCEVSGSLTGSAVQQSSLDAGAGRLMRADYGYSPATLVPSQFVACAGPANAPVLTSPQPLAALPRGLQVRFRAAAASTGAATIALDGLGARACRTVTGAVLPAGYIRSGADTVATWDGTYWVVERQTESGSNANGDYTRFADGRQICTGRPVLAWDSGGAGARLFSWWTFPAAFVTPVSIAGTLTPGDVAANTALTIEKVGAIGASEPLATGTSLYLYRLSGMGSFMAGNTVTPAVIATGRWY